ncbi:MAG: ParB/RepB/Spo0J family partition protein [bacterium]
MFERFTRGIIEREGRKAVVEIPVDQISVNPYQPRRDFDRKKLEELAQSIREQGVIQPVIVRRLGSGYELVAGERRLRASRMVNLRTIPAIVRDLDDQDLVEIAFIENLQREQLNEVEEADAYDRLLREQGEASMENVTRRVGKGTEEFRKRLWLLGLPQVVKKAVVSKLISLDHACIIAKVKNEKYQLEMLERIYRDKLSVEDTKKLLDEVPAIYRDRELDEVPEKNYSPETLRQLDICLSLLRDLILAFREEGIKVAVTEFLDDSSFNVRLAFPFSRAETVRREM